MSNEPNERVFNILKSYHPAFPEKTPAADFEYAKKMGFMFDRVKLSHDDSIFESFKAFEKCDKISVSDSFVFGLSRDLPQLRAALPAFAIMEKMQRHSFVDNGSINCADCAMWREEDVDFSFVNAARYLAGGIVNRKPFTLAFCLNAHKDHLKNKPTDADLEKLIKIFDVIFESKSNETPSTLSKKIHKIPFIKMNLEQSQYFLNTLGYAGILDTKVHRGFIFEYSTHLVPRKSRSSDWEYPVDFWTGADGLNFEGLSYWFGHYPEMSSWITSKAN